MEIIDSGCTVLEEIQETMILEEMGKAKLKGMKK